MSETLEQGSSGHKSLSSQVGGHPGVQSSEDGSLIFKPCLPAERDFYQLLVSGDERFSKLFNWTPKFYGTLRLEGKVKDDGDVVGSAESTVGSGGKRTAEDVVVSVQKTLEPAPEVEEKDKLLLTWLYASYLPLVLLHSPSCSRIYLTRSQNHVSWT